MAELRLKPGREKSVLRRHPWVFSGAVANIYGSPIRGETVRIHDSNGKFLAWGAYSPDSQITARIWSWQPEEIIGGEFFLRKIRAAIERRVPLISPQLTNAFRLVHGESDGIPGLIVDRYADVLVVQLLSAGVEFWRAEMVASLRDLADVGTIYERSDADVRMLEGLPASSGLLSGEAPPERFLIQENGLKFWVDIRKGHKTGFYLDQRDNRLRLGHLGKGLQVLDCFSYSGGFAVNAIKGGASAVILVDESKENLDLAKDNISINGLPIERAGFIEGNAFQILRGFRDQGRKFDVVVLDPPKFAPTAAQVGRATRGYKDINLLALKLLQPGGLLFTFSCSGGVSADLFQKIVASAALDASVQAGILGAMQQGPDHPIGVSFPEGAYLKGLIVQVYKD